MLINVKQFIKYNKVFFLKRKTNKINNNGIIFVNASYKDKFVIVATMKIASALSEILNNKIIILPHFKADKASIRIMNSYLPSEMINVHIILLKGILSNFRKIFKSVIYIKTGDDLLEMTIFKMPIGIHIYDTILKKMCLSTLNRIKLKHKFQIFFELSYFYSMFMFFNKKEIAFAVTPDNTYRDGLIYEIIKIKKIPCIAGIDFNGISIHKYETQKDFDLHCRVPDQEIIELVYTNNSLYLKVKAYCNSRFYGEVIQHDVIRAFSQSKREIDRKSLISEYNLSPNKKIAIVMAHIFSDAPHAYPKMLFKDYEEWLIKTCRRLTNNNNINYLVKEHPSAALYGEDGKVAHLLKSNGYKNKLLSNNINTRSLFNSVDVIITCGGTSGMECACYGIPVLLAAKPPYSSFSYATAPENISNYFNEIDKINTYCKLSEDIIRKAQTVLYVIHSVMQVKKEEIGLGTQEFYLGSRFNYDFFIKEMIEDCIDGKGYVELLKILKVFLTGKQKNLIDYKKLNILSENQQCHL
jgi:hypothetical protein